MQPLDPTSLGLPASLGVVPFATPCLSGAQQGVAIAVVIFAVGVVAHLLAIDKLAREAGEVIEDDECCEVVREGRCLRGRCFESHCPEGSGLETSKTEAGCSWDICPEPLCSRGHCFKSQCLEDGCSESPCPQGCCLSSRCPEACGPEAPLANETAVAAAVAPMRSAFKGARRGAPTRKKVTWAALPPLPLPLPPLGHPPPPRRFISPTAPAQEPPAWALLAPRRRGSLVIKAGDDFSTDLQPNHAALASASPAASTPAARAQAVVALARAVAARAGLATPTAAPAATLASAVEAPAARAATLEAPAGPTAAAGLAAAAAAWDKCAASESGVRSNPPASVGRVCRSPLGCGRKAERV